MHTFRLFQPYTQVVQGIFDKHTGNISPRFSSRIQIKEVTAAIKAELLLKAKVFTVDQVHGSTIVIVDQSNVAKVNHPQAADGLITSLPHVLLLIKTADCFPLFLFDPHQNVIGLIHLGWRGAAAGIHRKAINLLKTHYGSRPQDILVGIGPGICTRCFVSEKRPQQSDNPRWQPFITKKDNQWQVDIRGFVIEELQNAGIQSHHLEIMNVCTFENKNFFSHQRSKMTGEAEGRFASVIGIRN